MKDEMKIGSNDDRDLRQRTKEFAIRVVRMFSALQNQQRPKCWASKYLGPAHRLAPTTAKPVVRFFCFFCQAFRLGKEFSIVPRNSPVWKLMAPFFIAWPQLAKREGKAAKRPVSISIGKLFVNDEVQDQVEDKKPLHNGS